MSASAPLLFARLASKARLRHLQLISQIGELGSLQKAADAVHMSQPAATKALAELEQLLGTPLFERHAKGMRPTAVGTALLPLLGRAMRSLQECAELVSAMGSGIRSAIHVGAVGGGVSGLLCRAVPAFSRMHPEVVIQVKQFSPEELITGLQHSLDIAILRRPERIPQGFVFKPLVSDHYVVACSPRHPLAGRQGLSVADLARHSWLMPEQTGISGRGFERLWAQLGPDVDICWVTSRSPLLLWAMLEKRQLLRYVPYSTVRHQIDAGTIATIPGPWSSSLPPLGALTRPQDAEDGTPSGVFLSELARHGDLAGSGPAD